VRAKTVTSSTKGAQLAEREKLTPEDVRQDFLHRLFHDLATPLSAVALHLEGADRRVRRGADPSEALATARSELSRAFDLFEKGRECLLAPSGSLESFSFDELVASSVASNGASGVAVEGKTDGRVRGDRSALELALTALLTNAIEASGADSVSVRRTREEGRLRVSIENPGLLDQDPEKLFSPRWARTGRPWGMGLARARLSAAAAGGIVRLEQRSDRVTAILELPEETP
jgi:signal transduction histidine kinase